MELLNSIYENINQIGVSGEYTLYMASAIVNLQQLAQDMGGEEKKDPQALMQTINAISNTLSQVVVRGQDAVRMASAFMGLRQLAEQVAVTPNDAEGPADDTTEPSKEE